jgi:hypothetical protein
MQMSQKDFMKQFEEKAQRPTVEETHKRATFLYEKELLSRLDKLATGRARGFKTAVVNEALRRLLDELESDSDE